MANTKIWTPVKVGNMELNQRLAMAPMTRSRANEDGTVDALSAEYYSQRASMGLLISEGTQPSLEGQGYMNSPGIYNEAHIKAWHKVTDAVHEKGGKFFIQLMHAGRMNHPDNTIDHHEGVAPSAVAPENGKMFTAKGMQPVPTPRELNKADIERTIDDFRKAARAAIEAGADGVEIHGANGYLIHEFFGENSNFRTDEYGGSVPNKIRFAVEVAKAVSEEIGADRTGFRISPYASFSTIDEGRDGAELYHELTVELNKLGLAYLHILHIDREEILADVRANWDQALLVNRYGRKLEDIAADLDSGVADLISIGTWALANPDFAERLKAGASLNEADPTTFFGGGAKGYVDYPALNA
ncbi:NADH:flavin oxidoreductase [Listeria floridensis FSL S10-1187]|uniref:NADH:flavin oxidoreductase n=1 Tax=Listeria floridensis FSL S10-1187 TaxID=1265817 RepID=A0ABP3B0K1_9LIST|nr:alkene reductase [Listeria floridensis]EUJ33423.1 NADH:flavin oxidoreductase [Listeria floridensis FSL S10-1187]